jgi:hypothetical protein
MSIVLPALAVAFAAFCVWLGVRIYNRRERWAKWTAAGLVAVVVLVYPLSIGPACWIVAKPAPRNIGGGTDSFSGCRVWIGYWPIGWLSESGKKESYRGKALSWYTCLWLPQTSIVTVPMSSDGSQFLIFTSP